MSENKNATIRAAAAVMDVVDNELKYRVNRKQFLKRCRVFIASELLP
jgi:hypothetical protein